MIDRAGLEIRYTLMRIGGLNPSLSAKGVLQVTLWNSFLVIICKRLHGIFGVGRYNLRQIFVSLQRKKQTTI